MVLILALLPSVGIAAATATLDEQLIQAAKAGNVGLVKSLLDKGASVNAKAADGATPLIWAAGEGLLEVVRVLLERGADANMEAPGGERALIRAAVHDHLMVATVLIENGAKTINDEMGSGLTYGYFRVDCRHGSTGSHSLSRRGISCNAPR